MASPAVSLQLASCRHSVALLCQDKDYLERQLSELSLRAGSAEQRREALSSQLANCKQAKEALYQQLLKAQ